MKLEKDFDISSLFEEFNALLATNSSSNPETSIVDFAENILFNSRVKLFTQQKALLKAFYKEPLSDVEKNILDYWNKDSRTTWVENRKYNNLVLEAGRGSSKSTLASIIALYEFYSLISLSDPAEYYGLIPNDPIGIFVIATSQQQVKDTLYGKIKGYAENSSFFKNLVKNNQIDIQAEAIKCPAKNIAIYAKHTNSKALVGYTLKCLILDEVARFEDVMQKDGKIFSVAEEIYTNVGRGTQRFGGEGRKVAISSAWKDGDYIQRLWNNSLKDPSTLGFKLRTWDLNKNKDVSREACNSDYIADRAKAELEYEGIRTKNASGFIRADILEGLETGKSAADIRQIELDIMGRYYVGVEIDRLEEDKSIESFMHVDFSKKRDSTGICFGHPEAIDIEDSLEKDLKVVIDGLVKVIPYVDGSGKQRTISYPNIENFIIEVARARNVRLLTFDSFNSESTIQRLHSIGIETKEVNSSRNNQLLVSTTCKDLMLEGSVSLCKDSSYLPYLYAEIDGINIERSGKIVHGTAGKDLFDATVNVVYHCYLHGIKMGYKFKRGLKASINVSSQAEAINKSNRIKGTKVTSTFRDKNRIKKLMGKS